MCSRDKGFFYSTELQAKSGTDSNALMARAVNRLIYIYIFMNALQFKQEMSKLKTTNE